MSMSQIGSIAPSTPAAINEATEAERQWWASAIARYSRVRREKLGLSVERAAELSGLEMPQWLALEDNWIPEEVCVILAIAAALQVRWSDIELVAMFARAAQQQEPRPEC
jgi:transcriptional regulator with XRE-family HTH domain